MVAGHDARCWLVEQDVPRKPRGLLLEPSPLPRPARRPVRAAGVLVGAVGARRRGRDDQPAHRGAGRAGRTTGAPRRGVLAQLEARAAVPGAVLATLAVPARGRPVGRHRRLLRAVLPAGLVALGRAVPRRAPRARLLQRAPPLRHRRRGQPKRRRPLGPARNRRPLRAGRRGRLGRGRGPAVRCREPGRADGRRPRGDAAPRGRRAFGRRRAPAAHGLGRLVRAPAAGGAEHARRRPTATSTPPACRPPRRPPPGSGITRSRRSPPTTRRSRPCASTRPGSTATCTSACWPCSGCRSARCSSWTRWPPTAPGPAATRGSSPRRR